jgi:hypothetical protein
MMSRAGALLLLVLAMPAAAEAASLPAIKSGSGNEVPACTTPGRLLAYLKWRNSDLEPRLNAVPVAYMRLGEELGIRWDYAFFQMIVETGGLTFKRANGRAGDVRATQNNFAGLGATGKGVSGESFPDVASGVKAHLQHLMMYAGDAVADPVAERTRKVQEWNVLTSWIKGFKEPITYGDLARKWAPGSNDYVTSLDSVAKRFYDDFCSRPDPQPELVAEARAGRSQLAAAEPPATERISGADLARQARERARQEGDAARSSLGLSVAGASDAAQRAQTPTIASLLAAPKTGAEDTPAAGQRPATIQTASAAASAKPAPKAPAAPKCRVWTASYGGAKSIIIRSGSGQDVNYTVLDVNEGAESREVEAYVAAYAKGGQKVAEFADQSLALEKAFELCPEG